MYGSEEDWRCFYDVRLFFFKCMCPEARIPANGMELYKLLLGEQMFSTTLAQTILQQVWQRITSWDLNLILREHTTQLQNTNILSLEATASVDSHASANAVWYPTSLKLCEALVWAIMERL